MQQLQRPVDSNNQAQKTERFTRKQRMIAVGIAALIVTIIIASVQVLSLLCIIPEYWANIISGVVTTFGVLFAFLALLPILFPEPATTPPSPQLVQPTYRGLVGLPPSTDIATIEQRENVVQEVYEMLRQPETSCIVLTGIAGAGKSTLAALLYRFVEIQLNAGKGLFTAKPLWLRVDASVTLADVTGNLFEALGKSPPDFTHLSPQSQAMVLFNALNTMGQARLVILDQFEHLLDPQTGFALTTRPGVGEWLEVLNSQQFDQSGCRLLLTSRLWPKGTREYAPAHMREYEIKGLETIEGIELLQKLGVRAVEADLRKAVQRCDGHALALTLLATLLNRNRSLSLGVLLNNPLYAQFWTGDIATAHNLLDYIYQQQLDSVQRKLLLNFSVYREAVPLGAVLTLINGNAGIPTSRILTAFEVLLAQHLLQAVGEDHYQLHAIVASYARDHFDDRDDTANLRALQAAHMKAAQYYLHHAQTSIPSREKRRRVSDIHDLIEAVWQLCQAEQWQNAYDLILREGIFADLRRWGGNVVSLDLYQLLLPLDKWHPEPVQAAYIYNHLGRLYDDLGETEKARSSYEQVLSISREIGDGKREGVALNNLGRLSEASGKTEEARTYFEQALDVCRRVNDRSGEGTTLNNLGQIYTILGRTDLARNCLEQALNIFRGEVKYPAGEARAFNSLGRLSAKLGEKEQARDFYEQALSIYQGISDQRGESHALNNLGNISLELGQDEQARKYLEQALSILHKLGNFHTKAITLNDLGKVFTALGEKQVARDYYKQALNIYREEKDREEEGKLLLNLGMLYFEQGHNEIALAYFLFAKSIFGEVQSHEQASAQQRIDDLRGKVGKEDYITLLAQVEPRAGQIVEQTLNKNFS